MCPLGTMEINPMAMSHKKVRFVVIEHHALKAGLHWDLRWERPWGKKWDSFAIRKGVPLDKGEKVLVVKTHPHNEDGALFTGTLPKGHYGAGTFKEYDSGYIIIEKYSDKHYVVNFQGKKIKGRYHIISTSFIGNSGKNYRDQDTYIMFRAKSDEKPED